MGGSGQVLAIPTAQQRALARARALAELSSRAAQARLSTPLSNQGITPAFTVLNAGAKPGASTSGIGTGAGLTSSLALAPAKVQASLTGGGTVGANANLPGAASLNASANVKASTNGVQVASLNAGANANPNGAQPANLNAGANASANANVAQVANPNAGAIVRANANATQVASLNGGAIVKANANATQVASLNGGANVGPNANVAAGASLDPRPVAKAAFALRLRSELALAPAHRQKQVLHQLQVGKGGVYSDALASAIPHLSGEMRVKARDALAERFTRMTAATLRGKLAHANAEVRLAAALAAGMKDDKALIPDLVRVLADRQTNVALGANLALQNLTGQDFGLVDAANQAAIAANWQTWLAAQSSN